MDHVTDRSDPLNRTPPPMLGRQELRGAPRALVEGVRVLVTREPIYARLVAEWRAQGRTVPAEPNVPCASVTRLARAEPERS